MATVVVFFLVKRSGVESILFYLFFFCCFFLLFLSLSCGAEKSSSDRHTDRQTESGNSPVRIDAPFAARGFYGGDPLLGQRLVAGAAELPRVAFDAGVVGVFGFNVEPEMLDGDAVVVDGGEEFADLRGDGLAGYAGWLGSCA